MSDQSRRVIPTAESSILDFESESLPMHSGLLQLFDATTLQLPNGGIDFSRIKALVESKLERVPTFRKKIAPLPGSAGAVWIDDVHFDLDYHVRHTSLPQPGDDAQLKTLAARILEKRLDRDRPLWEIWVIEGLEAGLFAVVSKTHHALLAAEPRSDLGGHLLSPTPCARPEAPGRFMPGRRPTQSELWGTSLGRLLWAPGRFLQATSRRLTRDGGRKSLGDGLKALRDLASSKFGSAPTSPLNGDIGPHRSFETLTLPVEAVTNAGERLGASTDLVLLTILTGALRDFMIARQVPEHALRFTLSTPLGDDREGSGIDGRHADLPLPIDEPTPGTQLETLRRDAKRAASGAFGSSDEQLQSLTEWVHFDLQKAKAQSSHCVLSTLRGSSIPLYLLDAEQIVAFPQPPLRANHGLAIGLLSYHGLMGWGLTADRSLVPDLPYLIECLAKSAHRLCAEVDSPALPSLPPRAVGRQHESTPESRSAPDPRIDWPVRLPAPTCPTEVRAQICAQHAALSQILDAVERDARRVKKGAKEELPTLREHARILHDRLLEHMEFEESFLVPTVREIDSWGKERARAIELDHRDQREVLEFILGQLEDRETSPPVLVEQLFGLTASVRDDMQKEEQGVLSRNVLRDDVIAIDTQTG